MGGSFSYYFDDKPFYSSVNISSKERYLCDKYVFFMFFLRDILKETSVYLGFLESDLSSLKTIETHLSKKFNNIFLNYFLKFYQAPSIINFLTFQNIGEEEIFLYPKLLSCDGSIYNSRSLHYDRQVC